MSSSCDSQGPVPTGEEPEMEGERSRSAADSEGATVFGPDEAAVADARSGVPVRRLGGFGQVLGTAMVGIGKVLEPEKFEKQHVEAQVPEENADDDDDLLKRITFGGGKEPLW